MGTTATAMSSVHLKSVLVAFLACLSGRLTMFVAAAPAPMHPTNNKLHGVGLLMAAHSVKSKRSQELEKGNKKKKIVKGVWTIKGQKEKELCGFCCASHSSCEWERDFVWNPYPCTFSYPSMHDEDWDCADELVCDKNHRCTEPSCECAVM